MIMSSKKIIFLLFFIALASGFFWNQKMFGQPIGSDQTVYDEVAINILENGKFLYQGAETFTEPFYSLFLAGVYKSFGHNYDAVRVIQIFLFALTVVFVYLLALNIINQKAAVWVAVTVALFYGLANQAGNITTETLFTFLIVLFTYAIYAASKDKIIGWFAVSGIVLGLAALTRGIVQFLPILIVVNIFIFYYRELPIKKISLTAGIFLAGFLLVLLPWVARNRLINAGAIVAPRAGEILFARAELMENLYRDYPAHFIGHLFGYYFAQKIYPDVNSSVFRETLDTKQRVGNLLKEGKSYAEIDRILTVEAKNKIFGAPHEYFLMSVLDFISFNSPIIPRGSLWGNTLTIHPMFAEGRHPGISGWLKAIIISGTRSVWFAFMFFVGYGIWCGLKDWSRYGWLIIIVLYFNLAYSAIHAIPRYALPIYLIYFIFTTITLCNLYQKIRFRIRARTFISNIL